MRNHPPILWSIAGHDTAGGAGLSADQRAADALGVHLCPVVACVTAQHSQGVTAIFPLPADQLEAQLQRPPEKAPREAPERAQSDVTEKVSELGTVRSSPRGVTITISARQARELYAWISQNPDEALQALHLAQSTFEPKEQ